MMKFHKKLPYRNPFANHFFKNRVFGAFDIHLENVDFGVPLKLHRSGQPHDGKTDGFACVLPRLQD